MFFHTFGQPQIWGLQVPVQVTTYTFFSHSVISNASHMRRFSEMSPFKLPSNLSIRRRPYVEMLSAYAGAVDHISNMYCAFHYCHSTPRIEGGGCTRSVQRCRGRWAAANIDVNGAACSKKSRIACSYDIRNARGKQCRAQTCKIKRSR